MWLYIEKVKLSFGKGDIQKVQLIFDSEKWSKLRKILRSVSVLLMSLFQFCKQQNLKLRP